MFTYGNLLLVLLVIFCLYWGVRLAKLYPQTGESLPMYVADEPEPRALLLDINGYQAGTQIEAVDYVEGEVVDVPEDIVSTKQRPDASRYPRESARISSIRYALRETGYSEDDVRILDVILPGNGWLLPETVQAFQHWRKTGEGEMPR